MFCVYTVFCACFRMDLCFESKDKLRERLVHGAARVEDAPNYVWTIPGCDVHGEHFHALSVLTNFNSLPRIKIPANFICTCPKVKVFVVILVENTIFSVF